MHYNMHIYAFMQSILRGAASARAWNMLRMGWTAFRCNSTGVFSDLSNLKMLLCIK